MGTKYIIELFVKLEFVKTIFLAQMSTFGEILLGFNHRDPVLTTVSIGLTLKT